MATGLATRCPACGTVFRVVLDQLRVSDGWVRCGRCSHVFDAGQALVDLESGESRRLSLDTPEASAGAASQRDEQEPPPSDAFETTAVIERIEPPFTSALPAVAAADTPSAVSEAPQVDPWDRSPSGAPADTQGLSDFPTDPTPDLEGPPTVPTPSFLRRAERAERWRQPRVQAMLAGFSALAGLVLVLQVVFAYRDSFAAHWPGLRGALVSVCDVLGCSVSPPRAMDQISVESSAFVRVEKSSLYRLAVALRNRGGHDVALPAIEVAVSDGQGKLLARRVLRPAEMGASQIALGAGRDLLLQATLQIDTEPVSGYTVELFYP
ncbi:MAG TPA: DUF3426 domain-containing protein [Rubrivivax sp.]|nr:DUF3426 domain-containing protein [Rubrivivax sp.]